MKFFQEAFDTNIFEFPVYKLILDSTVNDTEIRQKIKSVKSGVVFCTTVFSNRNFSILSSLGFELMSLRTSYILTSKSVEDRAVLPGYTIAVESSSEKIPAKELDSLAAVLAKRSRYAKDDRLDKKKVLRIYTTWLENTFYHGLADTIITAKYRGQLVGFISLKQTQGAGYIDLIAVAEKHQQKKVGKALLLAGIAYLKEHGASVITLTTDGESVPLNAFYQKAGFVITGIEFVYHKHVE